LRQSWFQPSQKEPVWLFGADIRQMAPPETAHQDKSF
jgi:hypothetical protein